MFSRDIFFRNIYSFHSRNNIKFLFFTATTRNECRPNGIAIVLRRTCTGRTPRNPTILLIVARVTPSARALLWWPVGAVWVSRGLVWVRVTRLEIPDNTSVTVPIQQSQRQKTQRQYLACSSVAVILETQFEQNWKLFFDFIIWSSRIVTKLRCARCLVSHSSLGSPTLWY